jgi:hypothetical protein
VALENYGIVEVAHTALIHAIVDLKMARDRDARTHSAE